MSAANENQRTRRKLNRETSAKVYELMREQHYRANGYGYEPPIDRLQAAESIAEAEEIQTSSYQAFTFAAMDQLRGMAAVVAVIEEVTPEHVLAKVRGH